jgi:hypothetical protein
MAFIRGTAVVGFTFGLVNKSNGAAVTAGTTIGYITKDGGSQAQLADTPVHEGNGQWSVNLSASEMDAIMIGLQFVNSNAIPVQFTLKTLTPDEGDAAAGPAASTGESTLSYCYLDFRHEVGLFYGYGRSFYSPLNGTITIASGVVTLAGGLAWPAEAADMRLFLASGHYTVDTRDSATQLTLDDTTVNLASGSSFELHPWSDNELTDIDTAIIRGLRQFYAPPPLPGRKRAHNWSFLRQLQSLTTTAPYETGTVTVADGVVTLASGTWPSWADEGELVVGGVAYTVDSRDSDSQLTLDDTTVDAAAGSSYSLIRPQQDLPDSYGGFEGPLTYRPGTTGFHEPIRIMSELDVREQRMRSDTPNRPRFAFIRAKSSDGAGGQRWEIGWSPVPNDAYTLYGRMRVHPNRLTFLKPCPLGGMVHGETILESCLAIAESKLDDTLGNHHQRFMTLLAASIEQDLQNHSPEYLGVNRDYSDGPTAIERRDINAGEFTQYSPHSLHFD